MTDSDNNEDVEKLRNEVEMLKNIVHKQQNTINDLETQLECANLRLNTVFSQIDTLEQEFASIRNANKDKIDMPEQLYEASDLERLATVGADYVSTVNSKNEAAIERLKIISNYIHEIAENTPSGKLLSSSDLRNHINKMTNQNAQYNEVYRTMRRAENMSAGKLEYIERDENGQTKRYLLVTCNRNNWVTNSEDLE